MRSLFAFAWRTLWADRRRHLAPALTLAVGTALVVSAVLTGRSATETVRDGVAALGGVGDVGVVPTVGAPPLDASAVDRIRTLPGVTSAIPTSSAETFAVVRGKPDADGRDLTVTGVPIDVTAGLEGLLITGTWPERAVDVVLPEGVADDLGAGVGDRITIGAQDGARSLVVSGIADARALGLFAEDNVFVPLRTAWSLAGTAETYTRVELLIGREDRVAWAQQVRPLLPDGAQLQDTAAISDALDPIARAAHALVIGSGAVVMVIAVLLAGSTGAELRRRRRPTADVLHAVGAGRSWIRRVLLVEMGLVAAVATGVGAGAGLIATLVASSVSDDSPPDRSFIALTSASAVGLGVVAAVIAVQIGGDRRRGATRGPSVALPLSGVATGIAAIGVGFLARGEDLAASALQFLGATVAAASAASALRPVVGRSAPRLHWTMSGLGTGGRSALPSVVAVVVVFSGALFSAATGVSTATAAQIARQFGADVQVTAASPLPTRTLEDVRRLAGVTAVAESSVSTIRLDLGSSSGSGGADVPALAVAGNWFDVEDLAWRSGDPVRAREQLSRGRGVALPAGLADRIGADVGSRAQVSLDGATTRVVVVGTFTSLATGDQIVLGPRVARDLPFPRPTGWDVAVGPGADPVAVRDAVAEVVRSVPGAIAITAAEMRTRAGQQLVATFAGVFVLVGIAAVLGAVGTAGTYRALLDRRRAELAVLRAVGTRRRHLALVVRWEWAAALVAAVPPGLLFGVVAVRAVQTALDAILGVATPTTSVGVPLAMGVVLVAVVMGAATIGPARTAARTPPTEALQEHV